MKKTLAWFVIFLFTSLSLIFISISVLFASPSTSLKLVNLLAPELGVRTLDYEVDLSLNPQSSAPYLKPQLEVSSFDFSSSEAEFKASTILWEIVVSGGGDRIQLEQAALTLLEPLEGKPEATPLTDFNIVEFLWRIQSFAAFDLNLRNAQLKKDNELIKFDLVFSHKIGQDYAALSSAYRDLPLDVTVKNIWSSELSSLSSQVDLSLGQFVQATVKLDNEDSKAPSDLTAQLSVSLSELESVLPQGLLPQGLLQDVGLKSVSGGVELEVEGTIGANNLDFSQHQLNITADTPTEVSILLQGPEKKPGQADLTEPEILVAVTKPLILQWRDGIKMQQGDVELNIGLGPLSVQAQLSAGQCSLSYCPIESSLHIKPFVFDTAAVNKLQGAMGRLAPGSQLLADIPREQVSAQFDGLTYKGQIEWQDNRLSVAGKADVATSDLLFLAGASQGSLGAAKGESQDKESESELESLTVANVNLQLSSLDLKVEAVDGSLEIQLLDAIVSLDVKGLTSTAMPINLDGGLQLRDIKLEMSGGKYTVASAYQLQNVNWQWQKKSQPALLSLGDVSIRNGDIAVSGNVSTDLGTHLLNYKAEHSMGKRRGALKADFKLLELDDRSLKQQFTHWPYEFDVIAGDINLAATARWSGDPKLSYELFLEASLEDLTVHDGNIVGQGISSGFTFGIIDGQLSGTQDIPFTIRELDVGLPINNVAASVKLQSWDSIMLQQFSAHLLQGRVHGGVWLLQGQAGVFSSEAPWLLNIEALNIEELLKQADYTDLDATAVVDGALPVSLIDNQLQIKDGRLNSALPGVIRYQGLGESGNQLMGLVSEALSNYHYDSLSSTVAYGKDGDLDLGVKLKGVNPDMNNGQRINLNLNITDNIPSLMKSLQASRLITDTIEQGLN